MDFTADRDEATIATLLANLTNVIMTTMTQKNAIINELQKRIESQTPIQELEDK